MMKVIRNGHAVFVGDAVVTVPEGHVAFVDDGTVTAPESPPAIRQDVDGGGWQATGRQGNASRTGWYPTRELAARAAALVGR